MFKRCWIMGDIHGSYAPIENFIRRNEDTINFSPETDLMILLGDVGLNYYKNERDIKIKKKINKYPFTYFCIRGNHEARPSICAAENPKEWEAPYLGGPVWVFLWF